MRLDLLWTDVCFFLVLLVMVSFLLNGLRRVQTRQAYQVVFSKPTAIASLIVLLFFLMIGMLDSIHFKPNSRSVLDHLLAPIGDVYEKTYSAPMALTLYGAEPVMVANRVTLQHPLLSYPSQWIHTKAERAHFIKGVLLKALLCSGVLVLIGWVSIGFGRRTWRPSINTTTAFVTVWFCLMAVFTAYGLSRGLHVFGTGKIGQDILYYAIKSIRTGLIIGILTTLFMMPLALLLGISAGYFGGLIDDVIQYSYTTLSSIPGVLLISASVLSMQTYIENHPNYFVTAGQNADARLLALCCILGVTSWTSLCRILRAEVLKLREIDYVLAAKALGTGSFTIIRRHLLPNVMHIVMITLVLDFSFLVLAEAVLSYVGVGVSPMTISWGNMINAARLELARDPIVWWPMTAAFVFMFTLVLASNLLAEAVEQALNPRRANGV